MAVSQVELLTAHDQLLARSTRPLILKYRSKYIQIFRALLFALPITMGIYSESQKLKVNCFDWFQVNTILPLPSPSHASSSANYDRMLAPALLL